MKLCSKCKIEKNIEDFCPNKTYCKECNRAICKEYKKNNREKIQEYNKNYKEKNKAAIKDKNKIYYETNRKKIQEKSTKYLRERKIKDINFKITTILRSRLKKVVKNKTTNTMNLLGCSLNFFIDWLKFQFDKIMTLDNHGSYWHLDHIIPCSKFNLLDNKEQLKCFHWTNIRPLEKYENMTRKDNLTENDIIKTKIIRKKFLKQYTDKHNEHEYTILIYNKFKYL